MTKPFIVADSLSLIFEGHDGPEIALIDLDEVEWEEASRLLQDFEEEAYASSSFEEDVWDMSLEEYEALCASCGEDEDD